jgi:hypothetical protein
MIRATPMGRITVHAKSMSKSQCSTFVYNVADNGVYWTTDHVKHTSQDSRDTGLIEVFLQCSNSNVACVIRIGSRVIPQLRRLIPRRQGVGDDIRP